MNIINQGVYLKINSPLNKSNLALILFSFSKRFVSFDIQGPDSDVIEPNNPYEYTITILFDTSTFVWDMYDILDEIYSTIKRIESIFTLIPSEESK